MPLEELFESSLSLASTENTLRQLPQSRGVLLLTDKNQVPIQILSVSNLRRAAAAKLSEPKTEEPVRKADLRPIASVLFYTPILCELHCTWFYNRLVYVLFPDKTDELICLPPPHCVRIAPDEAWTAFASSVQPCQYPSEVYYGPFPTRKAAELFARIFNDVFALCRNRPLALGGKGQTCSYFQMGLCPAPCLNKGQESQYRQTVRQAIQAAGDPVGDLQQKLTVQMKTCAGQMQFEKAKIIKDQIAQLAKLKRADYRWTRRMDTLKILHIAQGPSVFAPDNLRRKSPVYGGLLITSDRIEKIPNFCLSSIPRFLDTMYRQSGACCLISNTLPEHIAMTSLFLYKSRPPGLWLDLNEKPGLDETALKNALIECFQKADPPEDP